MEARSSRRGRSYTARISFRKIVSAALSVTLLKNEILIPPSDSTYDDVCLWRRSGSSPRISTRHGGDPRRLSLRARKLLFSVVPTALLLTVFIFRFHRSSFRSSQCKAASTHSTNAKKLKLDDLRFALRKPQQAKQLARVEELLYLQEDIARARKNFDITTVDKSGGGQQGSFGGFGF